MSFFSRRSLLVRTAAALPASKMLLAMNELTRADLGAELYTVRNIIGQDPAHVLSEIREIGYTEVEATSDNLKTVWSAIQNSGMKAVSVHLNTDPNDEQLADAKQKGFQYAVVPYIPPAQRGGVEVMKKLAATLNKAGERAKAHGLQLCYHNHAFEFEPMGETTPLQILMSETQKDLVQLEMDIFWVRVGGHDPVELLHTYSGRVPLLHLKDKEKGVPPAPQYNERVPKDTFKEIGNGSIDIPAVLKAAKAAGVRHYFVEQDQTPDPIASLRQSFEYLSKHFAG